MAAPLRKNKGSWTAYNRLERVDLNGTLGLVRWLRWVVIWASKSRQGPMDVMKAPLRIKDCGGSPSTANCDYHNHPRILGAPLVTRQGTP